jgi:hypothetical protein
MSKGGKVNVFVDTQVFAASGFNFSSRSFRELGRLAREGQIRLLMPEAMVMECREQIERTHGAGAKLFKRFESYLKRSGAVNIPFLFSVRELFELLESRKCPLKRRRLLSEAAPILSLLQWCGKKSEKVYVIGRDGDLRAICAANPVHLVYCERVEDFVNAFADGQVAVPNEASLCT